MDYVRTSLIISGLPDNIMDWEKVDRYAKEMRKNDKLTSDWGFPPIQGFWGEIGEEQLDQYFNPGNMETMRPIKRRDIGMKMFFVTDGHHRAFGAQKAGIWSIGYELDTSGFVTHERINTGTAD